jgi:hypothetical protein
MHVRINKPPALSAEHCPMHGPRQDAQAAASDEVLLQQEISAVHGMCSLHPPTPIAAKAWAKHCPGHMLWHRWHASGWWYLTPL